MLLERVTKVRRQNGLLVVAFGLTLTAMAHAGLTTVYNNPFSTTLNDGFDTDQHAVHRFDVVVDPARFVVQARSRLH